ncbi:MAG: hypothetical protein NT062_23670 [Proteobacteria bacterium]|nr:hypothetical protein [Pseudomonadota bacterium]
MSRSISSRIPHDVGVALVDAHEAPRGVLELRHAHGGLLEQGTKAGLALAKAIPRQRLADPSHDLVEHRTSAQRLEEISDAGAVEVTTASHLP